MANSYSVPEYYTNQAAAQGGTATSLVTTGEKYSWNHPQTIQVKTGTSQAMSGIDMTVWVGTAAEYEAITTKNANTLYIIR